MYFENKFKKKLYARIYIKMFMWNGIIRYVNNLILS